jgi:hypothetical protein
VSGEFYYALRTNWFLPAAENGAPAMLAVLVACWDLDRVAQGNSPPHARIHYACLREVRAAQANVADIGFRFQVQYAKSNLRALGTRFQVAVFLERSCGIDHHLISLQFEHSITLIFIQPCRVN